MIYSKNILNLKSQKEEINEDSIDKGGTGLYPKTALLVILLVVALTSSAAAFIFWSKTQNVKTNPQKAAQNEVENLVSRVRELLLLPEDEQPTVATVTDPEKLKDQPFFSKAKSGDKVLIYTNARKAILYDPVQHKIIEVAPLNIGTE